MLQLPDCLDLGDVPAQVEPAIQMFTAMSKGLLVEMVQLEEARVIRRVVAELKLLPEGPVGLVVEYAHSQEWVETKARLLLAE